MITTEKKNQCCFNEITVTMSLMKAIHVCYKGQDITVLKIHATIHVYGSTEIPFFIGKGVVGYECNVHVEAQFSAMLRRFVVGTIGL